MPHLNQLKKKHGKDGLVILGIHTTNGAEKMAAFVKEKGVTYPVAADVDKKTVSAFQVDSYPDYYVIDRSGKLRFADLANAELDRAVETLLAEKPAKPAKVDARDVLKKALTRAKSEKKRLLVHLGAPW